MTVEKKRSMIKRREVEHAVTYKTPTPTPNRKNNNREVDDLSTVDHVVTSAKTSQFDAQLYIFEDNEAVIKLIIKGRSPTMRHVSRTRRVALDWLFDRINLDPKNPNQKC